MTDLIRGRASAMPASPAAPLGYVPAPPVPATDHDRERWTAEDTLFDAEAAEAAAVRKVRIAEALVAELGDNPKESARLTAQDRLETATSAYEAAETRTRRARAALQAVTQQSDPDEGEADSDTDLAYPHADAWLRGWLLPNWRRPVQQHWCPKWWLHAEAVSRIEAIWRAWEYLRSDGALGPSAWWRDHGDYHLAVLTSSTGPFARCNYRRGAHQQEDVLPAVVNPLNLADFIH